jgi:hypothetical protein
LCNVNEPEVFPSLSASEGHSRALRWRSGSDAARTQNVLPQIGYDIPMKSITFAEHFTFAASVKDHEISQS